MECLALRRGGGGGGGKGVNTPKTPCHQHGVTAVSCGSHRQTDSKTNCWDVRDLRLIQLSNIYTLKTLKKPLRSETPLGENIQETTAQWKHSRKPPAQVTSNKFLIKIYHDNDDWNVRHIIDLVENDSQLTQSLLDASHAADQMGYVAGSHDEVTQGYRLIIIYLNHLENDMFWFVYMRFSKVQALYNTNAISCHNITTRLVFRL